MLSNHFIVLENKDSEAETNPDEDYNILNSFKNQLNIFSPNKQEDSKIKEGPNINLKCFKKTYDTDEEKIYITKKIRTKKKTELCKNWEFFHDCFFKNECSFAHGMEELRFDSHISGSKVSKDLKLGPDKFALLKIEEGKIRWNDLDNNFIKETKSVEEIVQLSKEYTLGLTGDEYKNIDTVIKSIPNIHEMTQYISLYCRVSPTQKDDIIKDLIKSGRNPSMCGDGSNDVGALKRAIIGVAVLNIEETETQKKEPFNFLSFDDESTIKNGDVTAAAPFTSKSGSIKCIKNIFIQGRCTLVTNFQMYKILALNCLMTAYSESVLALKGIKFSDYQATIMGFVVSIFFLMLSRAKPLNKVNSNKPPLTIFTWPAIISILGQAVVDLGAMILILYLTEQIDPLSIGQEKSLDEKFTPTLINSIMFLFQLLNQTITFVVNYQGEPFMENLSTNGAMKKLLIGIAVFSGIFIFDLYPQLNENLELIPLPEDTIYRWSLIGIILINFVLCYLLEKWKSLFGLYESYPKPNPKKKKN